MDYISRLQQSKDSKDASKASMNAREAHLQLTGDLLLAEKRNLAAQSKLEVLKGQFPLNTVAILEAQYEAEAAQTNFMDLVALGAELFPEGVRSSSMSAEAPSAPSPKKARATATKPAVKSSKKTK